MHHCSLKDNITLRYEKDYYFQWVKELGHGAIYFGTNIRMKYTVNLLIHLTARQAHIDELSMLSKVGTIVTRKMLSGELQSRVDHGIQQFANIDTALEYYHNSPNRMVQRPAEDDLPF